MIERVQTGADYVRHWSSGGRRRKARKDTGPKDRDRQEQAGYYGLPVIHRSHWRWPIIVYFFLGGISGASYVLAAIAQLTKPAGCQQIVSKGRYLSIASLIPGALMLIIDLGRPRRFLMMFRVIKLRSPMSLGTWGLALFGACSTALAAVQALDDGLLQRVPCAGLLRKLPAGWIAGFGSLPAFFVSGYTGVLIAATAVPLWAKNALLTGPLFIFASMSSAVAAVKLLIAATGGSQEAIEPLERVERAALLGEIALMAASYRKLGATRSPAISGQNGRLLGICTLGGGIVFPLLAGIVEQRRSNRLVSAASSVFVLVGGFVMRYVVIDAGNKSADDPVATFDFARRK